MDLRDRKRIKNGELPRFIPGLENADTTKLAELAQQTGWLKFKTRWNNGGGLAALNSTIGVLGAAQQFNAMKFPTNYVDDFVGKYGTNNYGQIDGVGFLQYNDINTDAELNRMSQERDNKIMSGATLGATTGLGIGSAAGLLAGAGSGAAAGAGLGAWLGPIGAVAGLGLGALLGGIFGNKAKHEEEERMRIAQIKQNNANEFWRTGALSTALRNKELEQYGDTSRFNLLSGVKDGVERVNQKTGRTIDKHVVNTSSGTKIGTANAMLKGRERFVKADYSPGAIVKGDPRKGDAQYGSIKNGESIMSDDIIVPGTNMSFAEFYPYAYAMGKGPETVTLLGIVRENNNMKKNKLTHANFGLENFLANGLGLIQSWRDYNSAADDTPRNTNIKPFNKYERRAAELMAGRTISAYPQLLAITTEDAAKRYRINQSGGLSAMQKTIANLTNSMGSKIARANALANVQQIRNQFAKENAELVNNMGQWSADADMRASMFNEQQNAAANAARTQQMYMAKRNALDYLIQGFKNAWDYNQSNKMYGLYAQQVANETAANNIRAGLNADGTPKTTTTEQIVYPSYIVDDGSLYKWALPQFNWPIKWGR